MPSFRTLAERASWGRSRARGWLLGCPRRTFSRVSRVIRAVDADNGGYQPTVILGSKEKKHALQYSWKG